MKAQILQENLLQAVTTASRAASRRATLPILEHVLLEARNGELRVAGTNLCIGIVTAVGARVEEEGAITVPAVTLLDLVKAFPSEVVEMETDDRSMTLGLCCGRSKANVKGMGSDEFPSMPSLICDEEVLVTILGDDLTTAVSQVTIAACKEDTRPILTGCLMSIEGNQLTMAAADGFRLSVRTLNLPEPVPDACEYIVPVTALKELARICGDEEVIVTASEGRIVFRIPDTLLAAQLIDGHFPDYTQIIPDHSDTDTAMEREALERALRMVTVFAKDAAMIGRFRVDGDHVTINAISAETGEGTQTIKATVEGDGIEIAFNVGYLAEAVKAITTPDVVLETTNSSSPGLIRGLGDESFVHVIMPMHLEY